MVNNHSRQLQSINTARQFAYKSVLQSINWLSLICLLHRSCKSQALSNPARLRPSVHPGRVPPGGELLWLVYIDLEIPHTLWPVSGLIVAHCLCLLEPLFHSHYPGSRQLSPRPSCALPIDQFYPTFGLSKSEPCPRQLLARILFAQRDVLLARGRMSGEMFRWRGLCPYSCLSGCAGQLSMKRPPLRQSSLS